MPLPSIHGGHKTISLCWWLIGCGLVGGRHKTDDGRFRGTVHRPTYEFRRCILRMRPIQFKCEKDKVGTSIRTEELVKFESNSAVWRETFFSSRVEVKNNNHRLIISTFIGQCP
jgi:hypothetical protein